MKYEQEFPIFSTKVSGLSETFDLSDPQSRAVYFEKKAGAEIGALREYFEHNTFIAYLLGKKNAGKGTYTKLMAEIFGQEKIGHVSVGDIVREADGELRDEKQKLELVEYMHTHYRGYISVDEALTAMEQRDTSFLLPTEFILTLVKRVIDKTPRKALFIDGFPREMDQVSYSLYFRDLINYREDPDIFIAISIPNAVIDERIKYRAICPGCGTPRNLKLFVTKEVGYNKEHDEFFLQCDDPSCSSFGERMVGKEGDELGIEPIRKRIEMDDTLIEKVFSLHGIPRILLRNAVPVASALEYVDAYEVTPAYSFSWDDRQSKVVVHESPWTVIDDEGVEVNSLLAPAVVVSLIKQLARVLPR